MFISEAPPNLPEDLKLLYEDTVRAASIAHAMHRAMADPDSTFTLESLPPNVDNLSQAVQHSKAGLRRLESELNAVSGCRTHSNYHVAAVTEADR
ncbi:MAG TPA: hypothetical protein VGX70_17495, partial [Gemmataceae bacterium]|nr:hypothetical protein [Gemmataceae bacterium]